MLVIFYWVSPIPSMSEIEATYDAIASNPVAAKIYNALDVNLRTIIKVHSTAT